MINIISDESVKILEYTLKNKLNQKIKILSNSLESLIELNSKPIKSIGDEFFFIRLSLDSFGKLSEQIFKNNAIEIDFANLISIFENIFSENNRAKILCSDFTQFQINNYNLDPNYSFIDAEYICKVNATLFGLEKKYENLTIISNESIFPIKNSNLYKHYVITKTSLNLPLALKLSENISDCIERIMFSTPKLIIIDLDDTIWGGVLAEDPNSIRIGGHDHVGEAFSILQNFLKAAKDKGILLAVVSKNEEKEFIKFFKNNIEMPLSLNDFVTWKVNWEEKSKNIKLILNELNISETHTLFIDNSLNERMEVLHNIPEINLLDMNNDIFHNMIKITKYLSLQSLGKTIEDGQRTELYKTRTKLQQAMEINKESNNNSYISWLKTIKIKLNIEITPFNCYSQRVIQIFQRTNQFNLKGEHYNKKDIEKLVKENHIIAWGSISSIHGNEGIVLAAIIKNEKDILLNQYVMSCRVFGRYIEFAFLKSLKNKFSGSDDKNIIASFKNSERNNAAYKFLKLISKNKIEKEVFSNKRYLICNKKLLEIDTSFIAVSI